MSSLQDDLNTFHLQRNDLSPASGGSSSAAMAEESLLPETEPSVSQEIDPLALAQKVYDLLKQELKLEQERLGQRRIW